MGGMILCRSVYSKVPYYIEGADINVYSIEEISYFLYNDIYLVGADFFCEDLFVFIEKNIKEPELAHRLRNLKQKKAQLSELVLTVLGYVDFYSDKEISVIKGLLEKLDTQDPLERMKARADNFLANGRYTRALACYESIIAEKPKEISLENGIFFGNVMHNMGAVYARMFEFYDAADCFKSAYELNGSSLSKESAHNAIQLASLSWSGYDSMEEESGLHENDIDESNLKEKTAHWKKEYLGYIR